MKIRNGFVSNSSSSSFIVAFPHKPTDLDDMRSVVFQDDEFFSDPYEEAKYGTTDIAEYLSKRFNWDQNDIKNKLVDELEQEVCDAIRHAADDDCNSFTFSDSGLSNMRDVAIRELELMCEALKDAAPKTNWRKTAPSPWKPLIKKLVAKEKKRVAKESQLSDQIREMDKKYYEEHARPAFKGNYHQATEEEQEAHDILVDAYNEKKREWEKSNKKYAKLKQQWLDSFRHNDPDTRRIATALADAFLAQNPNCVLGQIELSDNNGDMCCAMEHGNLFRRLAHKVFSHH